MVIVWSRLVISGASHHRLHEELTLAGGELKDTHWFRPDGEPMTEDDWKTDAPGTFSMILHRDAADDGIEGAWSAERENLLLLFNASAETLDMRLPGHTSITWRQNIDTRSTEVRLDTEAAGTLSSAGGATVELESRSLQVWSCSDELLRFTSNSLDDLEGPDPVGP